jgi:hypothetical protein
MTLVEMLNSRAWEHRNHRVLRETAARRIVELENEVLLQRAVVTYGDRARMSNASDMSLQQAIDRAFEQANQRKTE